MKRIMVLVMILEIAASSLFGAGNKASGNGGSGTSREISLCQSQIRFGSSVDENLMRVWTDVIEKATSTKITIIAPTHNDYNDKLNVLLASGDYPDIIRAQQAFDTVSQYAVRGYLQPITKFINNDSRFAEAKNADLSMYNTGGEIYAFPGGKGGSNKIIWFRQDMIDKYRLNIKQTMTVDEFVAELRKVNKNEIIPFTFPRFIVNFQLFYNFFGAYGGILPDKNGQYHDGIQTNEMKQALLWVKSLYDEGLLDREFITNENAIIREKLASGKAVASIDYTTRYSFYIQSSQDLKAPTDFIPVYTLTGPGGKFGNLNETGGEAFCFSSKNKNIEASMDIINFLFFTQEGRKLEALGVEGAHYDIVNRVLVPRPAAVTTGYTIMHTWLSDGWVDVPLSSLGFSFQDISNDVLNKMLMYIRTSIDNYMGPLIRIPLGTSGLYDGNIASYNANLYEMATQIVLGSQNIDAAYAEYARFWRSINGDEMLRQLNSKR